MLEGKRAAQARSTLTNPRWEWMTGMFEEFGGVCVAVDDGTPTFFSLRDDKTFKSQVAIPDMNHPATQSRIRDLARKVAGDPCLTAEFRDSTLAPGADPMKALTLKSPPGCWLSPTWKLNGQSFPTELDAYLSVLENGR